MKEVVLAKMMHPLTGAGLEGCEVALRGCAAFAWRAPATAAGAAPASLFVAADTRLEVRHGLANALGTPEREPSDAHWIGSAYERWGEDCPHQLQGAFAAALWDVARRKLLLFRDRVGERALYWWRSGGRVLFASEPVQVAAAGPGPRPRAERLLAYILNAPPEPTWSFFEEVERLPEGGFASFSQDATKLRRWWEWSSAKPAQWDRRDAPRELAVRLRGAVEHRLPRRGECGVLLSGGLDSASVASQAADVLAESGRNLHAFTWTSRAGDGIDETPRSRILLANRPGTIEHSIEADQFWPLSRYPEAYSDPNSPEVNAFPDLLLATIETARAAGIEVLFNGIGGDPTAGWTAPELALLLHGKLPTLARRWRDSGTVTGLPRELRLACRRLPLPSWLTPFGERLARELSLDRPAVPWRAITSVDGFRSFALASHVNAASLERFDRLCRRHGIRIEAPWHDVALGELVLGLPDRAVDSVPPGKSLVREAMQEVLPDEILRAPPGKRETSTLRARGLLLAGRDRVERLLAHPLLAETGLFACEALLVSYRRDATCNTLTRGLWEALTAESWLRAAAAPL